MRVSIEGVISKCNNILNGLGDLEPLEDYGYSDVCDIIEDLNDNNPKFYAQLLKEFSYNLKLIKTQMNSVETPEEKLKIIDELFTGYCINSFKDENEQQKLLKELEL